VLSICRKVAFAAAWAAPHHCNQLGLEISQHDLGTQGICACRGAVCLGRGILTWEEGVLDELTHPHGKLVLQETSLIQHVDYAVGSAPAENSRTPYRVVP